MPCIVPGIDTLAQQAHTQQARLSPGEKRHCKRMAIAISVYEIGPYARTPEQTLDPEQRPEEGRPIATGVIERARSGPRPSSGCVRSRPAEIWKPIWRFTSSRNRAVTTRARRSLKQRARRHEGGFER
jgi:hypothetical protein